MLGRRECRLPCLCRLPSVRIFRCRLAQEEGAKVAYELGKAEWATIATRVESKDSKCDVNVMFAKIDSDSRRQVKDSLARSSKPPPQQKGGRQSGKGQSSGGYEKRDWSSSGRSW